MFWHDALFLGGCSRLKLGIAFSLLSSMVSSVSNFLLFYFCPFLNRISLNTLTLNVKSDKVYTRHGVPISVTGIAQVCLGKNSSRNIHSKLSQNRLSESSCCKRLEDFQSNVVKSLWFYAVIMKLWQSQCSWRVDVSLTFSSRLHFQVKIQGQNKEMLATACQMFMGKSEGEIAQIALETLEGHQRAIIAHLTVEVCAEMAEWQLFFLFFSQLITT